MFPRHLSNSLQLAVVSDDGVIYHLIRLASTHATRTHFHVTAFSPPLSECVEVVEWKRVSNLEGVTLNIARLKLAVVRPPFPLRICRLCPRTVCGHLCRASHSLCPTPLDVHFAGVQAISRVLRMPAGVIRLHHQLPLRIQPIEAVHDVNALLRKHVVSVAFLLFAIIQAIHPRGLRQGLAAPG